MPIKGSVDFTNLCHEEPMVPCINSVSLLLQPFHQKIPGEKTPRWFSEGMIKIIFIELFLFSQRLVNECKHALFGVLVKFSIIIYNIGQTNYVDCKYKLTTNYLF